MHISILCLGSHGDVLPFVTLGAALRKAGMDVRLITAKNFRAMVEGQGLDFYPIQIDSQAILATSAGQALGSSGTNLIRAVRAVNRSFGKLAGQYAADFSDPRLLETDALIDQMPGSVFGFDLAEKSGIPHIVGAVLPMTPTRAFPLVGFSPIFRAIPGYNALTYWFGEQIVWQLFKGAVNAWRRNSLDLPKRSFWGYSRDLRKSKTPVLNGFSQHVVPRPPDWGENVHVTGYWFANEQVWEPDENLRRTLEAGEPLVYVGFGSMPVADSNGTIKIVAQALRRIGAFGILSAGWGNLSQADLPDNLSQINYAPFDKLFPRMAAVVHHGGSGTTAAGLKAGVPSILVPFVFDQFYWGKRLTTLGLSPGTIPHKILNVKMLAEALDQAIHDDQIRKNCSSMAMKIHAEDGVQGAVQAILDYLDVSSQPGSR
jgi:UDP:flavonoid glycosyltransferase YjiC (YdhE family)